MTVASTVLFPKRRVTLRKQFGSGKPPQKSAMFNATAKSEGKMSSPQAPGIVPSSKELNVKSISQRTRVHASEDRFWRLVIADVAKPMRMKTHKFARTGTRIAVKLLKTDVGRSQVLAYRIAFHIYTKPCCMLGLSHGGHMKANMFDNERINHHFCIKKRAPNYFPMGEARCWEVSNGVLEPSTVLPGVCVFGSTKGLM